MLVSSSIAYFLASSFLANDLRAAAGSVVITPAKNMLIGGSRPNRMSTGIHDDLFIRCLVLEKDQKRLIFVTLDLLGFMAYDVMLIKKELAVKKIADPASVFIFSSHQHSGPDTIGLWGRIPVFTSGRNEDYLRSIRDKIVQLIAKTVTKTEPARLTIAKTADQGFAKNSRETGLTDPDIFAISVIGEKCRLALIVNFGCHPEALNSDNTLISADFPGSLAKYLQKSNGEVLFINGILGGMVTPETDVIHRRLPKGKKINQYEMSEAMGCLLGDWVLKAVANEAPLDSDWIIITKKLEIPIENHVFKLAIQRGTLKSSPEVFHDWQVITEISVLKLGKATLLLVPGEILPKLGLEIKKLFPGKYTIMFTLANDELGYIVHPNDWLRDLYSYERSMSVGKEAGIKILDAFKKIAATR